MTFSNLISNFELLVEELIPPQFDTLGAGRTVIQGYFLSISNPGKKAVKLRLNFNAITSSLANNPIVAFWDIDGTDKPLKPISVSRKKQTYEVTVPAHDTGLFILQPDVTDPDVVNQADTEVRGYLEASLASPIGNRKHRLLLSPEHRGTFLPKGFKAPAEETRRLQDFDHLVYSIPTAQGGTQFTFKQITPDLSNAEIPTRFEELDLEAEVLEQLLAEASENASIVAGSNVSALLSDMLERLDALETVTE
ncbi:MAG: hypothetical protein AAFY17_08740 [Cyanobacteria bacterium J06642_11]